MTDPEKRVRLRWGALTLLAVGLAGVAAMGIGSAFGRGGEVPFATDDETYGDGQRTAPDDGHR